MEHILEGEINKRGKAVGFQQVVDAINEAFNNKVFKVGNEFYGYTSNGLKIKMYIDKKTNKIISAFPEY